MADDPFAGVVNDRPGEDLTGPEIVTMLLRNHSGASVSPEVSQEVFAKLTILSRHSHEEVRAELLERLNSAAPAENDLQRPALNEILLGPSAAEAMLIRQLRQSAGGELQGLAIEGFLDGPSVAEARLLGELTKFGLKGDTINQALDEPSQAEARLLGEVTSGGFKGDAINEALDAPSQAEVRLLAALREGRTVRATEDSDTLPPISAEELHLMLELRLKGRDIKDPEVLKDPEVKKILGQRTLAIAKAQRPPAGEQTFAEGIGQSLTDRLDGPSVAEARLLGELTSFGFKGDAINEALDGPSQAEMQLLAATRAGRTVRATEDSDLLPAISAEELHLMLELRLKGRDIKDPEALKDPEVQQVLQQRTLAITQAGEQTFGQGFGRSLLNRLDGPSAEEKRILDEQAKMNGGVFGALFMESLDGPSVPEARIYQEQAKYGDLKGPKINDVLFGNVEPDAYLSREENVAWITKESLGPADGSVTVLSGELYGRQEERAMNACFEYWYRFGMGQEVTHQTMLRKYGIPDDLFQKFLRELSQESRQKLINAGMRAAGRGKGSGGNAASSSWTPSSKPKATKKPIEETMPIDAASDPLQVGLRAEDYMGNERLEKLLLPDSFNRTCYRLLNARELIKFVAEGGKMKRRQVMELENPRVFCQPEMIKELLEETARERTKKDVDGRPVTWYPGIVALSYAWASHEHPDPEGKQLKELVKALEWYMSERARLKLRVKREFNIGPGATTEGKVGEEESPVTAIFGIFIDYMCLHQAPFKGYEEQYWERELFNAGVLYAHERTLTLQVGDTKGGLGERVWERRGWCHVEGRLGELVAPRELTLNLASFHLSRAGKGAQPLGTAQAFGKTGAQLAQQGDGSATLKFLKAMGPPPRALVGPEHIRAELEGKAWTREADLEECAGMYEAAARALLAVKPSMLLAGCQLSDDEVRYLPGVLNACPALLTLEIAKSGLAGERAVSVLQGLEAGSLPQLSRLDLSENELGDAASTALAEALGGTAHLQASCSPKRAPRCAVELMALEELVLEECGLGPKGFETLLVALGEQQPRLVALNVSLNRFGDQGMKAFRRLKGDALKGLEDLRLVGCEIGDAGALILVEALFAGLLPAVAEVGSHQGCVDLSRNQCQQSDAALRAVLLERATKGEQRGVGRSGKSAVAEVSKLRLHVKAQKKGCSVA